jgi:hypothetical protein
VKIYAATVKALKKKERPQKVSSPRLPPLNANVFIFIFVFEYHPIYYDQTQGSSVVFITLWMDNFIIIFLMTRASCKKSYELVVGVYFDGFLFLGQFSLAYL